MISPPLSRLMLPCRLPPPKAHRIIPRGSATAHQQNAPQTNGCPASNPQSRRTGKRVHGCERLSQHGSRYLQKSERACATGTPPRSVQPSAPQCTTPDSAAVVSRPHPPDTEGGRGAPASALLRPRLSLPLPWLAPQQPAPLSALKPDPKAAEAQAAPVHGPSVDRIDTSRWWFPTTRCRD